MSCTVSWTRGSVMTDGLREGRLKSAYELFRSFARNRAALGGLLFLVGLTLTAILANFLFPDHPNSFFLDRQLQPPSLAYPFGTDYLGKNMLMLIAYGARTDLF